MLDTLPRSWVKTAFANPIQSGKQNPLLTLALLLASRMGTRRHCGGRRLKQRPWTLADNGQSATWNTETFAQNLNANAIRRRGVGRENFSSGSRRMKLPGERRSAIGEQSVNCAQAVRPIVLGSEAS